MEINSKIANYIKNFKNKVITTSLLCTLVLSFLYCCMIFIGPNDILKYVKENVQRVSTRNLEFGIDEEDGYYYIKNDDDTKPIKILQLTDIHLNNSYFTLNKSRKTIDDIVKMVNNVQPDLIVITGDFLMPFYSGFNTKKAVRTLGEMFTRFEIPFAFTYGNHDDEPYSNQTKNNLTNYFESLPYSLFQRGPENIAGQGNYIVKLLSSTGELKSAVIMMDSHSFKTPFSYQNIRQDQVDWYVNEVSKLKDNSNQIVPTHLYFHIPLFEFREALSLHLQGSDQVEYYFGQMADKRVASANEKGPLFDAIIELGSTKTVSVGHDHTHNFSILYKGVRLTYGMSMDYTVYPGISNQIAQRGGTLNEISTQDSTFELFQVPEQNNYFPIVQN